MKATLVPLRSIIEVLDDELASADDQFAALVAADTHREAAHDHAEHRSDYRNRLCRCTG